MSSVCLQLVSSFQIEAMARQQEGQQAKNKLSSVRKMIAKLLKSINEVRQLLSSLPLLYNKVTLATTSKCKNKFLIYETLQNINECGYTFIIVFNCQQGKYHFWTILSSVESI